MAASEATKRVHTKKLPPPMAAAGLLGPYLVEVCIHWTRPQARYRSKSYLCKTELGPSESIIKGKLVGVVSTRKQTFPAYVHCTSVTQWSKQRSFVSQSHYAAFRHCQGAVHRTVDSR